MEFAHQASLPVHSAVHSVMLTDVATTVSKLASAPRLAISNCWRCWEAFWAVDAPAGEMLATALASEGLDVTRRDSELGSSRRIPPVVNAVVRSSPDNSPEGDADHHGIGHRCRQTLFGGLRSVGEIVVRALLPRPLDCCLAGLC